MNVNIHLWLIPLLPFAGFLLNGILGSRLPKWAVTTIALLAPLASFGFVVNAALPIIFPFSSAYLGHAAPTSFVETFGTWINAGTLHIDFSFVLDQLSLVMLLVVTGVGFLIKRTLITVFMSIELMLNAVNLSFVTFAHEWHAVKGQIFVFFVMMVAAAEAAVGLAIIIAVFRARATLAVDRIDLMKL